MSILQVLPGQVGLAGTNPSYIYIETNNTLAEVLATGFLNQLVQMGYAISDKQAALVYTTDFYSTVLQITKTGDNYSLVQTSSGGGVSTVSGTAGEINSTMGANPILSLATTGIAAGAYTNPSVTVDTLGRVTAIASGSAPITAVTGTTNQIAISGAAATPKVGFTTNVVFPGTVTLNADPVSALEAATKQYVDLFAAGLSFKSSCTVATTGALTATYANGTSGVGATLTNAGANAALTIDGVAVILTNRVLVKDQAAPAQNGIYTVTTVGDGATPWVLTRATDADSTAELNAGDFVVIVSGTANANTGWIEVATVTVIGTSPVVYTQFGVFSTGVTSVNSADANRITVLNPTTTPTVNISATYVGQTSITTLGTIATGVWNGTNVAVANGGTGRSTAVAYSVVCGGTTTTAALQSVASVGTVGQVLTSGGAGVLPTWTTPTAGTVASVSGTTNRISVANPTTAPVVDIDAAYVGQASITTLGTVTTGVWNGTTVDVANGGSGRTSATAYALLCGGTTSTASHQSVGGLGTSGQVLTSGGAGALPSWATPTVGTVTSVSGTANRISIGGTAADPIVDIDAAYVGQSTITTLGTVATGVWNGTVVTGQYGGTGVANTGKTITLGGNLTTSGAFTTTLTVTANTNVTLPTSGTLAVTTAQNSFGENIQYQAQLKRYSETVSASGSIVTTATLDLTNGNVFTATVTGAVTLTFSNPATTGQASTLTLILTNGGSAAITWPASVKWAGGVAPTLTTSGVDILNFVTTNAGTTWYGVVAGKAFA